LDKYLLQLINICQLERNNRTTYQSSGKNLLRYHYIKKEIEKNLEIIETPLWSVNSIFNRLFAKIHNKLQESSKHIISEDQKGFS